MSERGYLDGVPLRLTSKFYPQPRPYFREVDIHIPIDALQDDYDFTLERSVIVEVASWEEHQRLEAIRRAEEAKLQAEAEAIRLEEEAKRAEEEAKQAAEEAIIAENARRLAEEVKIAEEIERLAEEADAEEEARRLAEEAKHQAEEARLIEEVRRLAEEVRISDDTIKISEEPETITPPTPNYPNPSSFSHPTVYSTPQWTPHNYFIPGAPPAPDIASRPNGIPDVPPPQQSTSNLTNVAPVSSANSFNKSYFPFLTSQAESRSLRDRQNHFSANLNQNYNPHLHSTSAQIIPGSNQNPYLHANCSPIQQFPILGALSQPRSNHFWPDGQGTGLSHLRMHTTYNNVTNPVLNGPLVNDSVHVSNSSHMPFDVSGSASNGTQHTLR